MRRRRTQQRQCVPETLVPACSHGSITAKVDAPGASTVGTHALILLHRVTNHSAAIRFGPIVCIVMPRNALWIVATIILDGLAGLSGGLLSERWLLRHQAALTGFAAGAILSAVFLDILPESIYALQPLALTWSFGGFVTLAVIEWIIGYHHHHHHHNHGRLASPSLPPSLLISDALHNVGDGAAVSAGFLISIKVGIVVAVAVIAHE